MGIHNNKIIAANTINMIIQVVSNRIKHKFSCDMGNQELEVRKYRHMYGVK